jgi:hypothetical protein
MYIVFSSDFSIVIPAAGKATVIKLSLCAGPPQHTRHNTFLVLLKKKSKKRKNKKEETTTGNGWFRRRVAAGFLCVCVCGLTRVSPFIFHYYLYSPMRLVQYRCRT